jgi:hypothetical protein
VKAIKTSPKGRSPGTDGIPYDFYKEYWDLIGEDTVAVLNDIPKQRHVSGTKNMESSFSPP